GRSGGMRRVEAANVGRFHGDDLRLRAQAWMQLAASHVHRIDAPCATREQHLGKSAGCGTDIETDAASRIERRIGPEAIEGGRELHPTAGYIRMRRLGAQRRVGGDLFRRLRDDELVGLHTAGGNGGLRLGPALKQAALDEKAIDANAAGHALFIERNDQWRAAWRGPAGAHGNKKRRVSVVFVRALYAAAPS